MPQDDDVKNGSPAWGLISRRRELTVQEVSTFGDLQTAVSNAPTNSETLEIEVLSKRRCDSILSFLFQKVDKCHSTIVIYKTR